MRTPVHLLRHVFSGCMSVQALELETRYERRRREEVMLLDIDGKIARAKVLIAQREEIDTELNQLLSGSVRERRAAKCSVCGEPGHRSSTCPSKQSDAQSS